MQFTSGNPCSIGVDNMSNTRTEWGYLKPEQPLSSSDDFATPEWLMNVFRMFHDPCQLGQKHFAPDSLNGSWEEPHHRGGMFINPPYSDPKPWVEKAIRTHKQFQTTIVMLLKHDSSTEWYRLLHEAGAHFLMFQGRLDFSGHNAIKNSSHPFPSVLAVLS